MRVAGFTDERDETMRESVASGYADGYAEGRRSALCMVVPIGDSVLYRDAWANVRGEWRGDSFRAYWLGMLRGIRLHWHEASSPTVLAARYRTDARGVLSSVVTGSVQRGTAMPICEVRA